MRVIAGTYRSRPLHSLRGADIRPTSDRLRETLFDILTGGNASALAASVWLDLFAGTGAVGIEALSRGAAMVYFVEPSRAATQLILANLRSLGVGSGYELIQKKTAHALASFESRPIHPDFIYLDPPYRLHEAYAETLSFLGESVLSGNALVIAEHEKQFDPGEQFGALSRSRLVRQGDAALSFYRR